MVHKICECGHEHRGRACILCDCPIFRQARQLTDKKPRVSNYIRRMVRRMNMNR